MSPVPVSSKIVLHLGLHKTATTALQGFLADNSKKLMAAGVRYFPLNRMRSDITPLFTSQEASKRARLQVFLDSINKPVALLSDENVLGSPGDLMQGDLYPFARNRLVAFCEENPEAEITLVLVLRDPQAFITSMYCEYLRHNPFASFERYIEGCDVEGFSYLEVFSWLSDLPERVRVRIVPFEPDRGGGVEAIARLILREACRSDPDIDLATFPSTRSRSSFSVEELDLAARIVEAGEPRTGQAFLNMLDNKGLRFGSTKFAPFAPDLAVRLTARYETDLAAFAEQGHGAAA